MSDHEMRTCPSCEEDSKPITVKQSSTFVIVRCPLCRAKDKIPQDTGVSRGNDHA